VTVKVLYFASLRELIGKSAEDVAWSGGTVDDLKKALLAKGGAYEKALSGKALVRVAVNQEMVQAGAPVKAGDEVAFFPPVTGG
jgi:molybdopterin synthase sulfur carrier subunit